MADMRGRGRAGRMGIEAACADALVRDQWTGKVGKRAKDMGNKSLGEGKTRSLTPLLLSKFRGEKRIA